LFTWRDFSKDDGASVKEWTNKQLCNDVAVALLAKAFTGERWTQGIGMFGLGDRVSMRHTTAAIGGLPSIMDVDAFRKRIEELYSSQTLDDPFKKDVKTFLDAWRKKESGRDD